MKTKRKRRRFDTSAQILQEIQLRKEKADKYRNTAAGLDHEADQLMEEGRSPELISIKRDEASKLFHKAVLIEDNQVPRLIRKLQELNTELIPGILPEGDRSVER